MDEEKTYYGVVAARDGYNKDDSQNRAIIFETFLDGKNSRQNAINFIRRCRGKYGKMWVAKITLQQSFEIHE